MKATKISLPAYFVDLSDGAKLAAIGRRLVKADKKAERRSQIAVFISLAAIALMAVTVTAFAATRPQEVQTAPTVIEVPKYVSDRIPWNISSEEEELVTRAVAAMARGEGNLTQQAVAQAIRNACETKNMTVEEAIAWGHYPIYDGEVPASCKGVTQRVMDGYDAVDAVLLYCYNPDVQSGEWHETQEFVAQLGNLRFFR